MISPTPAWAENAAERVGPAGVLQREASDTAARLRDALTNERAML